MFNGKHKAFTLSYDDGVTQDRRFIELINKYGLKSTFNINSELLGSKNAIDLGGRIISHEKVKREEVRSLYAGHEVAVHTLSHAFLPDLSDDEIVRQVEEDRLALSELVGYNVVGMAYPCGGVNYDARVATVIRTRTGVKYSRTPDDTRRFDISEDLLCYKPTIYHLNDKKTLLDVAAEFVALETDKPQLFYLWGHTYEFDFTDHGWSDIEEVLKYISGRDDIFYGTNREVFGL